MGKSSAVSDTTRISYVVFHGSGRRTGGKYFDDSDRESEDEASCGFNFVVFDEADGASIGVLAILAVGLRFVLI